ncbi:ABC transporter permease [Xanthovirga aplysinae]|uniref:ABC transporter permease n=1 Tax=Xanthovirga aplysinae TaxID=2529853 RepID=UPI0012BCDAFD|nr:hypothetical protein [Xanthovirga aplysinae]MTI30022.1 hypothetical protein [Xanthovirga aplysinae]
MLSKKITSKTAPIIVQFTICILFLSFTFLVFQQNQFIKNKDLGFEKDNLVMIWQPHMEDWWNMNSMMRTFDIDAKKHASIIDVTKARGNPGGYGYGMKGMVSNEKTGFDNGQQFVYNSVIYNWFEVFGMKLLAGKYYTKDSENDIIINYSACKKLGYTDPNQIIGTEIQVEDRVKNKKVIGVTEDVNFKSLKFKTEPVIFLLEKGDLIIPAVVKLDPEGFRDGLEYLEKVWKKVFPNNDFVYTDFS